MAKIEEGMEVCDSCEVHENLLKIVNEKMPEETELYDLAELFKVFGDSTRMRILFVLFEAEVCVCDLAEALNMTQSAISHQLRILKQNKLVKSRREGKSVFYSLAASFSPFPSLSIIFCNSAASVFAFFKEYPHRLCRKSITVSEFFAIFSSNTKLE